MTEFIDAGVILTPEQITTEIKQPPEFEAVQKFWELYPALVSTKTDEAMPIDPSLSRSALEKRFGMVGLRDELAVMQAASRERRTSATNGWERLTLQNTTQISEEANIGKLNILLKLPGEVEGAGRRVEVAYVKKQVEDEAESDDQTGEDSVGYERVIITYHADDAEHTTSEVRLLLRNDGNYSVDGVGANADGSPLTVSGKFKDTPSGEITSAEVSGNSLSE